MFYSNKLKKIKHIKHCFFSKKNGFSKGIYKSLNCGKGSKDNRNNIYKNLNFVAKKMGVKKNKLILMHQSHSNKVVEVKKYNFKNKINADAIITKMNDIAIGVLTADCVPIIICDVRSKIVGCIHAGWRGAFSGIIYNTIKKIKKSNSNNKIYASVGPCIGEKNYEVDIKFYEKFVSKSWKNKIYFRHKSKTKKLFDLRKFVTDKLLKLNVKVDQIKKDTFTEKSNFFSYRRSRKLKQKDYGRCISTVRLI